MSAADTCAAGSASQHGKKTPEEGDEEAPVSKIEESFHLPHSALGGLHAMDGLIRAGGRFYSCAIEKKPGNLASASHRGLTRGAESLGRLLLPAACSAQASLSRSLRSGATGLAVLGGVCPWEGQLGKTEGRFLKNVPEGPALKLQPLPLFRVSPINSIIHFQKKILSLPVKKCFSPVLAFL